MRAESSNNTTDLLEDGANVNTFSYTIGMHGFCSKRQHIYPDVFHMPQLNRQRGNELSSGNGFHPNPPLAHVLPSAHDTQADPS